MALKPQDVVVLLVLATSEEGRRPTIARVANAVGMTSSQVHASLQRATSAGLLEPASRAPNRAALFEFLVHGLRYVFWAERGRVTRGIPTAHAAPPLVRMFAATDEAPPVWPDPEGAARGEAFLPIHGSAVSAAKRHPAVYELLALVDAIRGGRARERRLAVEELKKRVLQS